MRLRLARTLSAVLAVVGMLATGHPLAAQVGDSARRVTGALIGHVVSSIDSAPASSVELRLLFVDSSKTAKTRNGDSLEVFLDSLRTRVAVTDSTGAFAIRRVERGHYLFRLRRIGYQPMDGVLTVGDDTLAVRFVMEVASKLLATMKITETSVDVVRMKEKLKRLGWVTRSHLGIQHTFVDRAEVVRRQRDRVGDILSAYGITHADYLLDRMPLSYEDIRDYPAELVVGIEIYRRSRPVEFSRLRFVEQPRFAVPPGGGTPSTMGGTQKPLVVIWTYIPGGE